MVAAEFKSAVSTIRIHDEYCEESPTCYISHLSRIVSNSYKRRQLLDKDEAVNAAAAKITENIAKT